MTKKPSASISKIEFSGGQEFSFQPDDKIILVGPNNSGKSQSLREIFALASNPSNQRPVVVSKIQIQKVGQAADLKEFLDANADFVDGSYRYKDWALNEQHTQFWSREGLNHGLAPGFIKNINANNRLNICAQQKSIAPGEHKSRPQHVLYDDEVLMNKISGLFRKAFGQDLMFDFRGGSALPIHVGNLPDEGLVDRVGDAYVAAVRSNPLLDQQGDGMKSYAGILFEAIVADLSMTLLDEPEAFLHPPQMRRLGETLASEVNGQLIVATHSSDIMRGFLEGTKGSVRVLRIRREGGNNFVSEAAPEVIQELWSQPELRYSNALEGVFHEETIICEDDSDCRLFNAIADHLAATDSRTWKDTAYVPTGGKHGVRKVAEVLRKIGVPVKAVFDIDFLNDKSLVEETVLAFGGKWSDFEELWGRVDKAIKNGVKPKSVEEIKSELILKIDGWTEGRPPRSAIIEAMKQNSAWNVVKKFGAAAIPSGDAQNDYDALKERLEAIGIYLVPVGEVENFCRSLGSHGPKFVNKLLTEVPFDDPKLEDLRTFVELVHQGSHAPLEEIGKEEDVPLSETAEPAPPQAAEA